MGPAERRNYLGDRLNLPVRNWVARKVYESRMYRNTQLVEKS
ncbi:hypothetical protein SAMN05192553_101703 [Cyclobacterium xiamenense]|uniref:Uncharacterized protein n=1 Tax=Cyclobacterium xiamenense TaxID=1297121 RepID=A0A1H6UAX7_9BACT|nr:hypothetical protein SAMN05192553_101703 [Cyclobacterium xiamenense]